MDFTFLTFAALAGSLSAPGLPPARPMPSDFDRPAVAQGAEAPCDVPSCLVTQGK